MVDKLQQAVALHGQGQLARARVLYEEILRAQPRHFDALHLLGVIAAVSGNPRKAVELIGQAIEVAPQHAIAHNNRGAAYQELGEWDAALAGYDRAVALDKNYAEPHFNRGNLFKDAGRWEEALRSYDDAIALRGEYSEAYGNRGIVLAALRRPEAALASYDRAIAIKADFANAHYNRANVLCELRQWPDALSSYDRAITLKRDYAEAYSNRAFVLAELGRIDEALASCNRALALKPDFAQAYSNRGTVLLGLGRTEAALASYDQALGIDPQAAAIYVNRGMARLLNGDFENGWLDYEWRWQDAGGWVIKEKRDFIQARWQGEPLAGRTILLHSEQGYGDTIQFCRYAEAVADLGGRVILEVPTALAALVQGLAGVAQVVAHGDALPPFDCYCPLLSLPLALKTTLGSIPAPVPYLKTDEQRRLLWKQRLGSSGALRVGVAWSGGFRPGRPDLWSADARRNVPLVKMAMLERAGIGYYSLQKGEIAESELAELRAQNWEGPDIADFTGEIRDFADTAAFIDNLDLVITVDTAVAHLAGALGKPVWILNRFDTCWRWLRERSDTPWYPTARLYRQSRAGDWESVLRPVSRDLSAISRRSPDRHC